MDNALYIIAAVIAGIIYFFTKKGAPAGSSTPAGGSDIPANIYQWNQALLKASRNTGIDWRLLASVVAQESGGDKDARGSSGEIGLMQMKPIAQQDIYQNNMTSRKDVAQNGWDQIQDGAAFLKLQLKRAGNIYDALRAYNQGYAGSKYDRSKGAAYAKQVINRAGTYGFDYRSWSAINE